jgi:SAM-dependent methyltransferase
MAGRSQRRSPPVDGRAEAIRLAAKKQWSHDPAGALAVTADDLEDPASFAEVEQHRYAEQPWMHDVFRFEQFAGQRVLEIGVGMGTDHLQFGRAGALMTGIDLTPRSVELTRRRFELEGLQSDLRVMDAERLEFDDDSFDVVYSFGVLHHIPSAETAFTEVRRVLRPGGLFVGALYNRWSLFIGTVIAHRVWAMESRRETWEQRLSRIEYSTAAAKPGPYVRLFGKRELRGALRDSGFRDIQVTKSHLGIQFNRALPPRLLELGSRWGGWYLIHRAS